MKWFWILAAMVAIAGGIWWATAGRSSLPEAKFVKPRRETLVSNLPTNAKVEPIEWAPVRVDSPGLIAKVYVKLGDSVHAGAILAQISSPGQADQVRAAQARTTQAEAEFAALSKGGKSAELADIESNLAKARFDLENENREFSSLKRLLDKQAATRTDVEVAKAKVHATELEIQSLESRRSALVSKDDLAAARARVEEAKSSERIAAKRLSQEAIHSPITGTIYNLPVRAGSFLNSGDLIADIGRLNQLRIRVYVDEPELGRVAVGQPVKITWDALPGKEWSGRIEHMPTQIVPLGTRQVGEVLCAIENPDGELAPGANVNAAIQTSLVPGALTVPKEALHIDNGQSYLFVLAAGNTLKLRQVQHGSDSVTRAQILSGLKDDDLVALPSEGAVKDGEKVKPVVEP